MSVNKNMICTCSFLHSFLFQILTILFFALLINVICACSLCCNKLLYYIPHKHFPPDRCMRPTHFLLQALSTFLSINILQNLPLLLSFPFVFSHSSPSSCGPVASMNSLVSNLLCFLPATSMSGSQNPSSCCMLSSGSSSGSW